MAICKEIVFERDKKMYVFDDVFEMDWRATAFLYMKQSLFRIGWQDSNDPHYGQHVYLHSSYSESDVANLGILNEIKDKKMLSLLEKETLGSDVRAVVNLSMPTDTYFAHSHKNTTLLYYANPSWKEEWAGETLFFNEELSEVVYTSIYKPGRVIIFDGSIPHSIRPQSKIAPQFRFTFTMFFEKNKSLVSSTE